MNSKRPIEDKEQSAETVSQPTSTANGFAGFRTVSFLTLLSRLMGLVRDIAMAGAFGAGPVMDAFTVAFRLPNMARRLFGEGAQTAAFLPAFISEQEQQGDESARRLAAGMFFALGALLTTSVVVGELFMLGLWWGSASPDTRLLIELLMILTPYLIFICLAAQQSAVMHSLRMFMWPALLPIVLNAVWIFGIWATSRYDLNDSPRIHWVSLAILIAGILQLVIPVWVLRQVDFGLGRPWRSAIPKVRGVFAAMTPILLGLTINQFNTVADSLIAWWLSPGLIATSTGELAPVTEFGSSLLHWLPTLPNGTASALYYGQRMYQFPLGVFGVALGTVLFPQLARHAERKDFDGLRRDLTSGLNLTISLGIPAGIGLMVLAVPLAALLFEHGRFTSEDTRLTASMIAAYGSAVWAFIGLLIVNRAFYAMGDKQTPLRFGLIGVACNVVLNVLLLLPFGPEGLAWATTISTVIQMLLATHALQRAIGQLDWNTIALVIAKTIIAASLMSGVCFLWLPSIRAKSFGEQLYNVLAPTFVGGLTYILAAYLLNLRTPWQLFRYGSIEESADENAQ